MTRYNNAVFRHLINIEADSLHRDRAPGAGQRTRASRKNKLLRMGRRTDQVHLSSLAPTVQTGFVQIGFGNMSHPKGSLEPDSHA